MSDAADAPVPRIASAPFDDPGADVILRTADHVDFRVMKLILKLASPVFKDMFSLPQPQSAIEEKANGQILVISVSEPSDTMDVVLRLCYPVQAPDLDDPNMSISLITSILNAAQKYDITAIVRPGRNALRTRSEKKEKDAFAAYAIACHFKMEEEARFAAVCCLRWRLPGPIIPELTSISGLDYYNLVQFHRK